MKSAVSKTTTRRQFATWLAAATAGVGAAAVAAPVTTLAAAPHDDSPLLRLQEQILEAWEASHADDDDIQRLDNIRHDEYERLLQEEVTRGQFLSANERVEVVYSTPDGRELDRLVTLSEQHTVQMAALIDKMWAIPAKTELGRSAKVSVLLACILDWRNPDEEMDWRELMARRLLVDLVGGDEAQSFREIYA